MLLKRSDTNEMDERLTNFEKIVGVIEDINDNKNTKFTAGLNFISVMTKQEKADLLNLDRMNITDMRTKRSSDVTRRVKRQLPSKIDWVARKGQPDVKNQGSCGSCWAFGAVSALEGRYFALTGEMVALSEQEYLDCTMEHFYKKNKASWAKDHSGCSGGWMHWAYDYSIDTKRMASMADFPYKKADRTCNMEGVANAMDKADVTGVTWYKGSDAKLAEGVVDGVVTVAIKVVDSFSLYRQGIFSCTEASKCDCSGQPNHAVALTGYTSGYWTVRNSWGTNWGSGGYIHMSRSQENICGINSMAQAPTLTCKPGQTCDGWENGDGEGNDGEEEEEEEKEFNIGRDVMCGEIKHYGGLCVDMDDTAAMNTVLTTAGCSREFCYTSKGYLQDKATDKCLTVSDSPGTNSDVITFGSCKDSYTWETTGKGFKIDLPEGSCWHPKGGSANPAEDTNVEIQSECDEDRNLFQMKETLCWEEVAGHKLGKKMMDADGKKLKAKKLDRAKNMCMATKGCKGINAKESTEGEKVYLLCSGNKTKPSKTTDSVFQVVSCNDSCEAGTMRCEDGECREKCGKEEEEEGKCPGGTTRCSDGVCRHEHMCH